MKLNREEIIKAFECCHILSADCLSCPFVENNKACASISLSALALIKELTTENEHLQDLLKEVQQYNEAWVEDNGELRKKIKGLKADTVRKMTDRLKARLPVISPSVFDQIAKAVLEEE